MLFPDYFAPIVLTVSFISIKAWFYGTKDKALNLCLIPPLKKKKTKKLVLLVFLMIHLHLWINLLKIKNMSSRKSKKKHLRHC